jgi:hypothetical protein
MMFRKAALLSSLAIVAPFGFSGAVQCVTENDAKVTIQTFTDIVPQISQAYFRANKSSESSSIEACLEAYDLAKLALDVAYAYNDETRDVLFKPTLTSVEFTYRNKLPGALSYFIGTECLNMAAPRRDGIIFPPGNEDGSLFQENGFGINKAGGGWVGSYSQDFTFLTGDENCETALAMGRICFLAGNGGLSCVDKTFSFVNSEPGSGQLAAILTSHHSSNTINTSPNSITTCQNPPNEDDKSFLGYSQSLVLDVTNCAV